jgi:hypothetical protein
MQKTIQLHGKAVQVELTGAALHAVKSLQQLLVAEIHLIFGCLVVKRVWFKAAVDAGMRPVMISDRLGATFRVVRYTKSCRISHIDNGDELPMDFPLVGDKRRYVPDWLKIDFRNGKWVGSYGYGTEEDYR